MNFKSIKIIYTQILVLNHKIKYLGGDKYRLTRYFPSGEKCWDAEYKNEQRNGKIYWYFDTKQKYIEENYVNGHLHGTRTVWNQNGSLCCVDEFENGKKIS